MRGGKINKLLLILLIVSMSFTGCVWDNTTDTVTSEGIECGFEFFSSVDGECCEPSQFYCGYKTDKTEFDIDDVMIDLYYGGDFYDFQFNPEYGLKIPSFDIYISCGEEEINKDSIDNYLIRRVEEEFVSAKYDCELKDTQLSEERVRTDIVYNHHEIIKIPKEAFENGIGRLDIVIFGKIVLGSDSWESELVESVVFYQIKGEKVVLSTKPFDK